jgi:hypothetical protein
MGDRGVLSVSAFSIVVDIHQCDILTPLPRVFSRGCGKMHGFWFVVS